MTLSPHVDDFISNSLIQTEQGVQLVMDPNGAQTFINEVSNKITTNPDLAAQPILLTSPTTRRHIYKLVSRFIPQLVVLSHNELSNEANVQSVSLVEVPHAS